jgi:IS30 family transposase
VPALHSSRAKESYGPALHATKPNELLHWDFLTLPQSETGAKYVLVLRDDMSGFVEFTECSEATAEMVLAALMDWFSRFGVVYTWVTDQGTHFKNQLIEHLRKQLGVHHHFTRPYCPWSNGTVEVVNPLLLRCLKALLSERKMQESEWPKLLKLV